MKESESNYDECIKCGEEEFTTQEPSRLYICESCYEKHADEENAEYEKELEAQCYGY